MTLIRIENLSKIYKRGKETFKALCNLSLTIEKSETLGLVGESGCGKTTAGKCLLQIEKPSSGEILYNDKSLLSLNKKELFSFKRRAQIIFQDPYSSLNPRMSAEEIIAEPLKIHKTLPKEQIPSYVKELAAKVGLSPSSLKRFPHEFSGGQRQRIGIARALSLNPEFIVCDEPVSALDVPIQAQIINLLKELQQNLGLTYLFITHNLAVVRYISDRIAVLYKGYLVELAPSDELYNNPLHPYTQELLSSIPSIHHKKEFTPSTQEKASLPTGCPFAHRCPHAHKRCLEDNPELITLPNGHQVACHLYPRQN